MTNPSRTQSQQANSSNGNGKVTKGHLSTTSSTPSRVQILLDLGLSAEELAEALRVKSATTIRNWAEGIASPRREGVRVVDDLRRVVVLLGEAGLSEAEVAQWLRSRQGGVLDSDRPLEVINEDPIRVLVAANALAEASRS
jgi:DNA-binding transcriptional regulator YiaG